MYFQDEKSEGKSKENMFTIALSKPDKKAGSVDHARWAAFFCLDFSLLTFF
jgi:hypothetical protein